MKRLQDTSILPNASGKGYVATYRHGPLCWHDCPTKRDAKAWLRAERLRRFSPRPPLAPPVPIDDANGFPATVAINVGFVPYGYQIDTYIAGQLSSIECRDFGGSYPLDTLVGDFVKASRRMVEAFRKAR